MDVALRGKAAITKARIGPSTHRKTYSTLTLNKVLIQRVLSLKIDVSIQLHLETH